VDPCVFCAIVEGTAEASFVYRDDRVAAFLDIGPVTAGHLIVIPLRHLASLADIPDDLGAHLFVVASRLAAALRRSSLPCEGVNLLLADGEAAFQDVFHAHLHVFARTTGDGFTIDSPAWSRPKPSRDELDANAAVIRAALG
jgi:histidine triad (HIT) family protein